MNLMLILKMLQDFRSQLENWGVTAGLLVLVGLLSSLLVFISLREILGWYLKTHHLREEVRELNVQLQEMRKVLGEIRADIGHLEVCSNLTKDEEEGGPKARASGPSQFRLDH
jgi:hypothetical protein